MKVTAIMGGLGQSIPGSMRSWLFGVLNVQHGQPLLNRGATSSLGPAAVNIAVNAVAIVTAKSRRRKRFPQLQVMGVYAARVEGPDLVQQILKQQEPHSKFDAMLNLVGNSVLLEMFDIVRRGGHLCQAGWLGGLAPIADFNPMVQMASGIHFSIFRTYYPSPISFLLSPRCEFSLFSSPWISGNSIPQPI